MCFYLDILWVLAYFVEVSFLEMKIQFEKKTKTLP